jgi:hypothetical protein
VFEIATREGELCLGVWFAYPPKIIVTWNAMVNVPIEGGAPFSLEGFLFYPRALLELAGSWWMITIWSAVIICAFRFRHDRNVRLLLVFISLQLLIGQIHHTKLVRHHTPILPAIFLLTGHMLSHLSSWSRKRNRKGVRMAGLCGLAAGLIRSFNPTSAHNSEAANDPLLVTALGEVSNRHSSVMVIGTMDMKHPSAPLLDWELVTVEKVMRIDKSGIAMNYDLDRSVKRMLDTRAPATIRRFLSATLKRSEASQGVGTLYIGLPPGAGYSSGKAGLARFLKNHPGIQGLDAVVALTSRDNSAKYRDFPFHPVLSALGFTIEEKQVFSHTAATTYTRQHKTSVDDDL